MSRKRLYAPFEHWYHGGNVFLYSDPHFGDEDNPVMRPDYPGDDEQVRRINSKVGKNDTIVILGDVGDESFVRRIRGYKVLVMGNHDKGRTKYLKTLRSAQVGGLETLPRPVVEATMASFAHPLLTTVFAKWVVDNHAKREYDNDGLFDEVYEGPVTIAQDVVLSHVPIDVEGMVNLHGHVHSTEAIDDDAHVNLVAERIGYVPVPLDRALRGKGRDSKSATRRAIDAATKRKRGKGR